MQFTPRGRPLVYRGYWIIRLANHAPHLTDDVWRVIAPDGWQADTRSFEAAHAAVDYRVRWANFDQTTDKGGK